MIHLSKYRILLIFILLSTIGVYSCRNSNSREEKKDTDHILLAGSSSLHNLNTEESEGFSSKSLFLENGGNKMALIFIDNEALPSHVITSAKEKISADLGMQGANILIVQNAPFQSANRDSLFFQEPAEISPVHQDFIDKISESIKEAQKNVQEAEIAWANVGLTADSLRLGEDGSKEDTIKNPTFENASSDFIPEATFLAVRSIAGDPIALLGNYNPKSGSESDLPSSFYRGVNKQIESLIGQLGEGSSFISVFLPTSYTNIERQKEGDLSDESLPLSEQAASSIAAQYQRLEFHQHPSLISSTKNVTLQLHSLTSLADTSSNNVEEASKSETSKEYPKEADFPLQTLLIGEYALAALPFEVSQETVSKIKEANVFSETLIIPYGNGNWGKLPSSPQENEANEGNIDNNIFQEDAALIVSDQILDQFSALRAEKK